MAGGLGGSTSYSPLYGAGEIGPVSPGKKPTGALGGGGAVTPTTAPKATGGGGAKFKAPKIEAPKVTAPPRPELPPIDPQAPFDPVLEAYRDRYGGHLTGLEQGTGYAMDVLRQQQQDATEAEVERMRAAAAQAGIPFDESEARAELQRGINAAMAQEKLGREAMMTEAYGVGRDIYALPPEERFKRLGLDLQRDVAEQQGVLDLYAGDLKRYGIDVGAATAANTALLGLYNSLMSGMFGMMGSAFSPSYSSSVHYG